jgi:hypothetical protein
MAYRSSVVKNKAAIFVCALAALLLGLAVPWSSAAGFCAVTECCCSDSTTEDPCLCGDHSETDVPEMAATAGMAKLAAPPSEKTRIPGSVTLAGLPPVWQPALPWHAPPDETRRRLSVWIL